MRRLRSATRWLAGGAVVLTGAFAGLAAHSTHQTASTASGQAAPVRSEDDDGGSTLQAPAQAPQQAPGNAAPQASSGAS